jgi:hypothetical protein
MEHEMTTTPRPTPVRRPSPDAADRPWRRWNLVGLTVLASYSTALGWQAQQVSYPLYRAVRDADFGAYHQLYNEAIPLPVIVPGFACFLAAMAFPWTRPRDVPRAAGIAVGLVGLVSVTSTVLWAIPMHDRLDEAGPLAATIDSLLHANLVRTLALTAGTATLAWCTGRLLRR